MRLGTKMAVLVVVVLAIVPISLAYLSNTPNGGSLKVYVADKPVASVSAVYITFTEVALHNNVSGWTNYSVGTSTINILGLTTTNASLLKSIALQPATYTMIRLYIQNVTVVLNGVPTAFRLSAPFAFINHPFNVQAFSTTSINIDFHLTQCLNEHSLVFTPHVGYTVS